MTRALIAGGCGFVGSHILRHFVQNTDWELVSLDRYSVSGTLHRLVESPEWPAIQQRVELIHHDLRSPLNDYVAGKIGQVDYIFCLAASSHVDRSILDPLSFVMDNVVGHCNLLEFARKQTGLKRLLYFGTDESYGVSHDGYLFKEWDRYRSTNPYSASKSGANELTLAYHNTYGVPAYITSTMNVIGSHQHPEKFLPSTIRKVLNDEPVIIHATPDCQQSGWRYYIDAKEVARALLFTLDKVEPGDKINIVGQRRISNLELAQLVAGHLGRELKYEMLDFHSTRRGHDLYYALDGSKLASLGFQFERSIDESIKETIDWYVAHPGWLL